jgi:glycosyltransferase involved in cell wall biosynthesis
VHTADCEPFGRVIIEAMGHNVPVIAINKCGPSEIIQNGETGILVNPDNIKELSEAMLKIAGDKGFALKLASAAYEYVTSRFSAETTAKHIQKIYQQFLAA